MITAHNKTLKKNKISNIFCKDAITGFQIYKLIIIFYNTVSIPDLLLIKQAK